MARQPKAVVDQARTQSRRAKGALDPSTPSLDYLSKRGVRSMIATVLGGTATMRDAGRAYLPQHEGEGDTRYKDRLTTAVFTNYTQLTLEHWTGKPFSKPAKFTADTDPDILKLEDDIDLCGNELTVVLKNWFTLGMQSQNGYCLVEYPKVPDDVKARGVSLKDMRELNLRPYWVVIPAAAMISAPKERINGRDIFVECRFYDNEVYRDGFVEAVRTRIREIKRFDRDGVVTIEQRVHTKKSKDDWSASDWVVMDIDEIPLVDFDTGKMELEQLAYLNITHWQSNSDQRNCLTTARFPILAGSGVAADTVVTIGPYQFLASKDTNSKFYYVEHTGAALEAGAKDIESLIEDMALYGAEMLKQRPDRETATSRVLDSAENTAPLQVHVFNFISCVEQALWYTGKWMDKPDDVIARVEMDTDFAMSSETSAQVTTLKELRKSGDISREMFLESMKELGALPDSFDLVKNQTQLDAEASRKADAAAEAAKKLAAASPKPEAPAPGKPATGG